MTARSLCNRSQRLESAACDRRNATGSLTEFGADCELIGGQGRLERHDPVEPGEENLGLFGVEDRFLDLDEPARIELAGDPHPPVRSYADEFLTFLPFTVGQIVRHAPLYVGPFLAEIAFGFKDRPADQGVKAAPHFRHAMLEIERGEFSPEFLDEQLPKVGLDLVMAWLSCEMAKNCNRGGVCHGRRLDGCAGRNNEAETFILRRAQDLKLP